METININPKHTMQSQNHNTPHKIIFLAKKVLGKIDLDPCTNEFANSWINAKEIFTINNDGIKGDWFQNIKAPITIWCNPPGSKHIKPSLAMQFWNKLTRENTLGNISHALFLAYSIEQLQQSQKYRISMMDFPVCIPSERIKFLDEYGLPQRNPTHANAIIYIPGKINNTDIFVSEFSYFGRVKI